MITHQPTPEQLKALQKAHLATARTEVAVAEARAKLYKANAEHAQAEVKLSRAIADVLYGPQDEPLSYSAEHGPELQTDL